MRCAHCCGGFIARRRAPWTEKGNPSVKTQVCIYTHIFYIYIFISVKAQCEAHAGVRGRGRGVSWGKGEVHDHCCGSGSPSPLGLRQGVGTGAVCWSLEFPENELTGFTEVISNPQTQGWLKLPKEALGRHDRAARKLTVPKGDLFPVGPQRSGGRL